MWLYRGVVGSLLRWRPIGLPFEMEEPFMTCTVRFGEDNTIPGSAGEPYASSSRP